MKLYRIRSKHDGLGPMQSITRYRMPIKPHANPLDMDLTPAQEDIVDNGECFYFYDNLQSLCDTFNFYHPECPTSKGWCAWVHEWEVIAIDTIELGLTEGIDYHILENYQVIVHHAAF